MATYANNTIILLPRNDSVETVIFLQTHKNLIDKQLSNWKIKSNSDKSI